MGVYEFFSSDSFSVFLSSFAPGMVFAILYDLFRIKRCIFPLGNSVRIADDFLFMVFCSVIFVFFCFAVNNGVIRWYMPVTCLLMFFLYKKIIGDKIIFFIDKVSNAVRDFIKKIIKLISEPVIKIVIKLHKNNMIVLCKLGKIFKKCKKHFSFLKYWCRIKKSAKNGFGFGDFIKKSKSGF